MLFFFCVFPFLWFSLPLSPIKFLMEWREWEVYNVVNYASTKVIPEKTNAEMLLEEELAIARSERKAVNLCLVLTLELLDTVCTV